VRLIEECGGRWCTWCVLEDVVDPAGFRFLEGSHAERDVVELQHSKDGDGYLLEVEVRGEGDYLSAISH